MLWFLQRLATPNNNRKKKQQPIRFTETLLVPSPSDLPLFLGRGTQTGICDVKLSRRIATIQQQPPDKPQQPQYMNVVISALKKVLVVRIVSQDESSPLPSSPTTTSPPTAPVQTSSQLLAIGETASLFPGDVVVLDPMSHNHSYRLLFGNPVPVACSSPSPSPLRSSPLNSSFQDFSALTQPGDSGGRENGEEGSGFRERSLEVETEKNSSDEEDDDDETAGDIGVDGEEEEKGEGEEEEGDGKEKEDPISVISSLHQQLKSLQSSSQNQIQTTKKKALQKIKKVTKEKNETIQSLEDDLEQHRNKLTQLTIHLRNSSSSLLEPSPSPSAFSSLSPSPSPVSSSSTIPSIIAEKDDMIRALQSKIEQQQNKINQLTILYHESLTATLPPTPTSPPPPTSPSPPSSLAPPPRLPTSPPLIFLDRKFGDITPPFTWPSPPYTIDGTTKYYTETLSKNKKKVAIGDSVLLYSKEKYPYAAKILSMWEDESPSERGKKMITLQWYYLPGEAPEVELASGHCGRELIGSIGYFDDQPLESAYCVIDVRHCGFKEEKKKKRKGSRRSLKREEDEEEEGDGVTEWVEKSKHHYFFIQERETPADVQTEDEEEEEEVEVNGKKKGGKAKGKGSPAGGSAGKRKRKGSPAGGKPAPKRRKR